MRHMEDINVVVKCRRHSLEGKQLVSTHKVVSLNYSVGS